MARELGVRLELDQVEVEPILEMGDDIIQTLKDKAWPVESIFYGSFRRRFAIGNDHF